MKKLFSIILLLFSMLSLSVGLGFPTTQSSAAGETKDKFNYLSLGDSICAGTYIEDSENKTYESNYTNLLANEITTNVYDTVLKKNYGKDGDNTSNFLSKITGLDANGNALVDDALSLSLEIQQAIADADLITISIGTNDILGPANANLMDFLVSDTDISPFLDAGLANFVTNFPRIVARLEELNPNAKFVFTNIYNPYLELMSATENITISTPMAPLPITKEKIQLLGTISEAYINSSSSSIFPATPVLVGADNKNIEKGVNQLLGEYLAGKENFSFVDTKSAFDGYFVAADHYAIVNCSLLDYDGEVLSSFNKILDPHPSELGHALMFQVFKQHIEANFVFTEFYFDGANANSTNDIRIYHKNTTLAQNDFPSLTKSGYSLTDWKISPDYTTSWDSDYEITSNTTFKAVWTKEHLVMFDTKGGSNVPTERVLYGQKATRPAQDPTKTDSVFVGWFANFNGTELPWNFENSIEKDVTIYAKWAYTTCEGELSQKADNTTRLSFAVVNGEGMTYQWVVNKEPQEGETTNEFFFTAPEIANKTYDIYCLINGQKTNSHVLKVGYIIPANIEIKMIASSNNTYRFTIVSTENIDTEKCVWYKQVGETISIAGNGASCEIESETDFSVFVEYDGRATTKSNEILIEKEVDNSLFVYVGLGSFLLIASVVLFIFVIKYSKKKKLED